jgi:hypothetical protein
MTDTTRWQSQYQQYDTLYKSNYLSIPSLNEFDSYNGTQFMGDVAAWQRSNGFGGFMTFAISSEYISSQTGDARYPLSTALYNAALGGVTDLRTQLINTVVAQVPANNTVGIRVNGDATLMNADQWACYYSEIRAPINTDPAKMMQVLDALGIPSTEPQRSSTLIAVDQFIAALSAIGLGAIGAVHGSFTPSVKLPMYICAVVLLAGALLAARLWKVTDQTGLLQPPRHPDRSKGTP